MLYEFRVLMNGCALLCYGKPLTFVGCICVAISTQRIYPLHSVDTPTEFPNEKIEIESTSNSV